MRGSCALDEFAAVTGQAVADLERYRDAGLLDLDGDGLFDELDLLRLHHVLAEISRGGDLDSIAADVRGGRVRIPLVGDLLFRVPEGGRTAEQAAAESGLEPAQIESLGTALGLPSGPAGAEEIDSLRTIRGLLDAGMSWQAILDAARVYGDSLRRIAEVEVRLVDEQIHRFAAADDPGSQRLDDLIETLSSAVDPMLRTLHRRHLLHAALKHSLDHLDPAAERSPRPLTIAFVDLTSFTSLTHVHGDEVAAQVLDRFDGLVRRLTQVHGGTLIKQIGDEFMLTFADPADAVRFALELEGRAAEEDRFPALKVGIHTGQVLYRLGDYVGETVNLAARIASAATARQILVTEPVARAAEAAGIAAEELGVRMMRGISDAVALFRVVRTLEQSGSHDPVCGMLVTERAAAGRLTREGIEYAFCSEECLRRFLDDPARYAGAN